DNNTPLSLPEKYLSRKGYRLPSEAEWEYACRAGALTSRYYGSADELLDRYAWYQHNSDDLTWPVGQKRPNDFGLFDMLGEVWQGWQEGERPYPAGTVAEPAADVEDTRPVSDKLNQVLRGGSFIRVSSSVRCAVRFIFPPSDHYLSFGMRVARTL